MTEQPKLLSGDNPQIPKGEGQAPVTAYLNAVPGWKQSVCRKLDELIVAEVPEVRKAVKWNTPLYGMDGTTWFTAFRCTKNYVKITFFQGSDVDPVPPETSTQPNVRYAHIREQDAIDEGLLRSWFSQASALPGEKM